LDQGFDSHHYQTQAIAIDIITTKPTHITINDTYPVLCQFVHKDQFNFTYKINAIKINNPKPITMKTILVDCSFSSLFSVAGSSGLPGVGVEPENTSRMPAGIMMIGLSIRVASLSHMPLRMS
jgi:hypothetical protein